MPSVAEYTSRVNQPLSRGPFFNTNFNSGFCLFYKYKNCNGLMVPIAAFIDQRGLIRKILGKFYVSQFFWQAVE